MNFAHPKVSKKAPKGLKNWKMSQKVPKTGPEKCEFRASKSVKKDSKSVKKLKNEPKSAQNGSHLILRNATFAQPSRFELVINNAGASQMFESGF